MVTTIQIKSNTLALLKQLKKQTHSKSYDETITKITIQRATKKSMGGYLAKYYKKKMSKKDILKNLRDKHDRF